MAESLFSPSWYRVANLKLRLRSHVEIHRHHYRGDLWYVLEDHASGQYGRFTPAAYQIVGLMDGKRTVQEICNAASESLGQEAPTQEEVIRLLSKLHGMDALQSDVVPDTAEMLKRFEKKRFARWKQNLQSPLQGLFAKFPVLVDRLMIGTDWHIIVREPKHEDFISRYKKLFTTIFGDAALPKLMGGNALAFLGLDKPGGKNRVRLEAFYAKHAIPKPKWWVA